MTNDGQAEVGIKRSSVSFPQRQHINLIERRNERPRDSFDSLGFIRKADGD